MRKNKLLICGIAILALTACQESYGSQIDSEQAKNLLNEMDKAVETDPVTVFTINQTIENNMTATIAGKKYTKSSKLSYIRKNDVKNMYLYYKLVCNTVFTIDGEKRK